jgi:hypothetical protein
MTLRAGKLKVNGGQCSPLRRICFQRFQVADDLQSVPHLVINKLLHCSMGGELPIERVVTSESKNAQETHSTKQTYSAILPGASLEPGSAALVQQVSASRQTAPEGSSQSKQQIQVIDFGNPASGLQLATLIIEISQPAAKTKRHIVRSSNGRTVQVTDSQETRIIP